MRKLILNILIPALTLCTAAVPVVAEGKDFTVVIDPGHGGKDHGAPGKVTNEKSINLAVARKIVALIEKNMPEVNIVQTRSDDRFVTLQGRADIANKAIPTLWTRKRKTTTQWRERRSTLWDSAEARKTLLWP